MASRGTLINLAAQRVIVVGNPGAGSCARDDAIRDLLVCLEQRGMAPQLITDLRQVEPLVERYQTAGQLRAVVAAGGDGTVAEIVNRTSPEVPLTVYPLGTANLLANYLGLTANPLELARVLAEGAAARLDAGRANGRIFVLMIGCGFDAEVVRRLHRSRNGKHIRYWTYARPILDAIRSYRYPHLKVYCEMPDGSWQPTSPGLARWAFVVNLPCYAAGLQIVPEAVGTDGKLNVCTFGRGSLLHGLRYLGYIALRRHRVLPDYACSEAKRIRIEADEPVPYQMDGDPGGVLPLEIEVMPERLTVVAPLERLSALGLEPDCHASAGAL